MAVGFPKIRGIRAYVKIFVASLFSAHAPLFFSLYLYTQGSYVILVISRLRKRHNSPSVMKRLQPCFYVVLFAGKIPTMRPY
jgi:hypothetical protein